VPAASKEPPHPIDSCAALAPIATQNFVTLILHQNTTDPLTPQRESPHGTWVHENKAVANKTRIVVG
jgi:hypothetical protein